jgi:two-component system chemotaxis response regulator CheY
MKTVLVVDDDEGIRKFVRDALAKRRGWVVLEAEDGVDGIARFMLHRPEVIITDISMPNKDGFEMIDVLRKGDLLQGVRIVVMSGVLDVTTIIGRDTGAAALLSKPFSLQALYQAVGD